MVPACLGIVQRFAIDLFDSLGNPDREGNYQVTVSFLELYNEDINDLLASHDTHPRIRQNMYGTIDLTGVHQECVQNSEELLR